MECEAWSDATMTRHNSDYITDMDNLVVDVLFYIYAIRFNSCQIYHITDIVWNARKDRVSVWSDHEL